MTVVRMESELSTFRKYLDHGQVGRTLGPTVKGARRKGHVIHVANMVTGRKIVQGIEVDIWEIPLRRLTNLQPFLLRSRMASSRVRD
jgi:hypothetical protein